MARGSSSFLKRQKEMARQQHQRDKAERKKQRKLDKAQGISDTEPTAEGTQSETEADNEQSQPTQEDGAQ